MALILNKINIGDTVTFNVYPAALLGTKYSMVKVTSLLDATTVRALGRDPAALHAKVFGTLPVGTPDDPNLYQWIKVVLSNGEADYLGVPWIRPETIVINQNLTITVTLQNGVQEDIDKLRLMYSSNGYTGFTIVTR